MSAAFQQQQQQQHRGMPMSSRLNELLEAIRNEFENVAQDTSVFRMQRDEFEHKIGAQISEMNQIQQNVYELDRAHQKMKLVYEEDILRLRRELETRGIPIPPPAQAPVLPPSASQSVPGLNPQAGMSGAAGPYHGQPLPQQGGAPGGGNYGAPQSYPNNSQLRKPEGGPVAYPQQPAPGAPAPAAQAPRPKALIFGDVDPDTIPASNRKEGTDWLAIFSPKLPRTNDINMVYNFDHASVVCCVNFSYDGKFMATGCNRTTQIFDITSGQKIATLLDGTGKEGDLYIRSVCFSPDGKILATGAEDKQIRLWDISEKKISKMFGGHEQDIYSLDFSRDGRFLASGSGDRTAKVWDVEQGKCVYTLGNDDFRPKDAGITSVAISPDGKYVAAGSLDRIVRIWDLSNGQFVAKLEGHKDSVYSVAFSPDSRFLVSGSLDKSLKLWELANFSCKSTFVGHKDFVLSVAFSQDGKYVISGSKDRNVQFWDLKTGVPILILQGHKNSVISVALGSSGGYFATGSGDCRARVWSITDLQAAVVATGAVAPTAASPATVNAPPPPASQP